MIDLLQSEKKLTKPVIRVWCHPKSGKSDFWNEFNSLEEAKSFIDYNKYNKKYRVEELLLIAYDGYELSEKDFRKKYPKINIK